MPRRDLPTDMDDYNRHSRQRLPMHLLLALAAAMKRKPPRRPPPGGSVLPQPVEPPRPRPLSGGAAAELEFDE